MNLNKSPSTLHYTNIEVPLKNGYSTIIVQKQRYGGFTCFTLIDFCAEPRLNLINIKDKASISLDLVLSGGVTNIAAEIASETKGTFRIPSKPANIGLIGNGTILLSLNFKYHSTYNNIDHGGFSFGGGIQQTAIATKKGEDLPKSWYQILARVSFKSDWITGFQGVDISAGFLNGFSIRSGIVFILNY